MKMIVTGADGALGQVVVAACEAAGHRVAALYGGPDVSGAGRFAVGDLAQEGVAQAEVAQAAAWLGHVDALVHLAGGFVWRPVQDSSLADWRQMFEGNVLTAVAGVQATLPHLADGGTIVLVGARSAEPAGVGFGPYGAAKSGVARLAEALSAELAPRRIRVNAVLPAIIDTPRNRIDMPDADPADWTSPAAIADVIAFLVSPAARAVNGALLPVSNPTA